MDKAYEMLQQMVNAIKGPEVYISTNIIKKAIK